METKVTILGYLCEVKLETSKRDAYIVRVHNPDGIHVSEWRRHSDEEMRETGYPFRYLGCDGYETAHGGYWRVMLAIATEAIYASKL